MQWPLDHFWVHAADAVCCCAGEPSATGSVGTDGGMHGDMRHMQCTHLESGCGRDDGMLPACDHWDQGSGGRVSLPTEWTSNSMVTESMRKSCSISGQPHHRHRMLHDAGRTSSCGVPLPRGSKELEVNAPPFSAECPAGSLTGQKGQVKPGRFRSCSSVSCEPGFDASSAERLDFLATATSAPGREQNSGQCEAVQTHITSPVGTGARRTYHGADRGHQAAHTYTESEEHSRVQRGVGPGIISPAMETPRAKDGSHRSQYGAVDLHSVQEARSSTGAMHSGAGDGRWAECIRYSVAGALDQAMEALEAELGYTSSKSDATGRAAREGARLKHGNASASTPLSDLARMDIGADRGLFSSQD